MTDLPTKDLTKSTRILSRMALALVCTVAFLLPTHYSHAQEAGLRGTGDQQLLESNQSLVKKPKVKLGVKKRRVAEPEITEPPLERYKPDDLEAVDADKTADTDTVQVENSEQPASRNANSEEPISTKDNVLAGAKDGRAGDASSATSLVQPVRRAKNDTLLDSEVQNPALRAESASALEEDAFGRVKRNNLRTGSIEGKVSKNETNPFDAPGIRAGTFILRPTLEAGVRGSSNPNDPSCNCPANRAESALLLRAESDWARHALNVEAKINLRKAFSNTGGSSSGRTAENGFRLAADGRVDVTVADQIIGSASYERAREVLEGASTPSFSQRPMVNSLRGSVGYTHDTGLISLGGTLNLTRQSYTDALNIAGVAVSQGDRDYTNMVGALRVGYNWSPAIAPFVELELGRRQFDNKLDSAGLANSATRYALRLGTEIDLGEKLRGELAGGWFVENIDDAALKNVSGFDLRGTVNWSPMRDTNVAFVVSTQVDGAQSLTSSTSVLHLGSAALTRRLRDNLDTNALVSISHRDFQGAQASQIALNAELGATWWFNRFTGVKGSVQHSATLSSDIASKQSSTGVYLGVILRR